MYKKMLVLLDGSKLAEVVFSYAKELSGRLGVDLDLLYVCTAQQVQQMHMIETYVESMAARLQAQSEEVRNKAYLKPGKKALKVTGRVAVGYPAEEILKYTDANKVDLIMLATHGASGDLSLGLGSVAEKIIRGSKIPVWLVPGALHPGIIYDKIPQRNILVPLDGSKQAEAAIPHAVNLAKQRGVDTRIVLITVSKPVNTRLSAEERQTIIGKDIRSLRTTGEVYLNKMVKQLIDAGLTAESEQLVGDPAEEIVRYAARTEPRVIVMCTHGHSGFRRFVFGSVTENVLHRLQKTPLFLIKTSQQ